MDVVPKATLGADVIAAIVKAKTDFQHGKLREFAGAEFSDSVAGRRGAKYYEADVGQARPGDPKGLRGRRRLVCLLTPVASPQCTFPIFIS